MSARDRIQRGRPDFAVTQREDVLRLLRQAGASGLSREFFIFSKGYTQAGARIDELEAQGFKIEHFKIAGEKYVRYRLLSEPLELQPLPEGSEWYEAKFGKCPTGLPEPPKADLPLFDAANK